MVRWVVLVVGALCAVPLAAQENGAVRPPELTQVRFLGHAALDADSLEVAIVNRETTCRSIFFRYVIPLCPLGLDFAWDRHFLQPEEVRRDAVRLELYHWQRGFREAEVDTSMTRSENGEKATLTFEITEGRPTLVDTILYIGDEVPDRTVLNRLPLEVGDRLSFILMDATRDSLQSRLRNRGYAHAEVLRNFFIPSGSYEAEVEYDVFTGPLTRFGEIDVRWTHEDHSLDEESVVRFLPFREGDRYSRREILRAQRALFGVDLIQSANVAEDTLSESPDSVVPLTVTVTEGDVHRVGAGVGWSFAECFNAESQWTSRNFMGGARRLTVRGRVSNVLAPTLNTSGCPEAGRGEFAELDYSASAELVQPWLFSSRNSLSLSVFGERASLPDIFIREAVGATFGVSRSLAPGTQATLSYEPQLSRLQAAEIFFCTSFLVCEPSDVSVLANANWLAPVGLRLSHDRTDDLLNPSDGYRLIVDLEHASGVTASDFAYDRVVAEAAWYEALARRTVVAGRLRTGWIGRGDFTGGELTGSTEIVHPQKRFYSGGASSVRGFAQNRLGPRVLQADASALLGFVGAGGDTLRVCSPEQLVTLACEPSLLGDGDFLPRPTGGSRILEGNIEYRLYLGGPFQAAGFVDFGQVWREGEPLRLSDTQISPGVGVRYFSPIGPIRVDIGYNFRGAQDLQVVTTQIRPARPEDDPGELICVQDLGRLEPSGRRNPDCGGATIPWVRTEDLAVLDERFLFGDSGGLLGNLQIHLSIGQAF